MLHEGAPLHTMMMERHVSSLALDSIWPRHRRHGSSHLHQQEWSWVALCVQVALFRALLCFAWRGGGGGGGGGAQSYRSTLIACTAPSRVLARLQVGPAQPLSVSRGGLLRPKPFWKVPLLLFASPLQAFGGGRAPIRPSTCQPVHPPARPSIRQPTHTCLRVRRAKDKLLACVACLVLL